MSEDREVGLEIFLLLLFLTLACMRGCWHAGRIADKLTPESGDGFSDNKGMQ